MIRIFFAFLFLLSALCSKQYNSFLEFELDTLSHLDAPASFVLDENFKDYKSEITQVDQVYAAKILNNNQATIANIKRILKEENMPSELLYLAMVESTFNPESKSSVKAIGIWQFMEPTAKKLGLRIDSYIDERKDPIRSTKAAIKYLKQLKKEFGKWYLAIMAYNCGNGKLRSAIREAGSDELSVLLDEDAKYIPLETRRFFKKIVVMALLSNNKDYLLSDKDYLLNYAEFKKFQKINIKPRQSVKDIAKDYGLSYDEFKKYNPHYKSIYTPPYPYDAYIPKEKLALKNKQLNDEKLLAQIRSKYSKNKHVNHDFISHVVKSGDNLGRISNKYNCTIEDIKILNNLKSDDIKIGQTLVIPVATTKSNVKIANNASSSQKKINYMPKQTIYIVQKGDTLSKISREHNCSIESIKLANSLENNNIRYGQKLIIP